MANKMLRKTTRENRSKCHETKSRREQTPYQGYVTAFTRTGLFSRGNGNPAPSMSAHEKRKLIVIKRSEIPFSGLLSGLWDLKDTLKSRQNRSKNILVGECIAIREYGRYTYVGINQSSSLTLYRLLFIQNISLFLIGSNPTTNSS